MAFVIIKMIRLSGVVPTEYEVHSRHSLVKQGDDNNVARLHPKNIGCGPRVKKVAHPCSIPSLLLSIKFSLSTPLFLSLCLPLSLSFDYNLKVCLSLSFSCSFVMLYCFSCSSLFLYVFFLSGCLPTAKINQKNVNYLLITQCHLNNDS